MILARGLRPEEQERCLEFWRSIWPNAGPGYFERYFRDPTGLRGDTRCCLENGEVVAAVHFVRRVVRLAGVPVSLGGIANVATRPDYRGQGLASDCMRQAVERMDREGLDASMLGTGINAFYARFGFETAPWQAIEGVLWRPGPDAAVTPGVGPLTRVRSARAKDRDAVMALYDSANDERPLAARRSPNHWANWLRWPEGRERPGVLVAEDSTGRLAGYCFQTVHSGRLTVSELGVARGAVGLEAALIGEAARIAAEGGAVSASFIVPREPDVDAAARAVCSSTSATVHRGRMVRFSNLALLLRRALPELSSRWRAAGRPRGRLVVRGTPGCWRLQGEAASLQLEPWDEDATALTQAEVFGLLSGSGEVPASQADQSAFALALFPAAAGHWWSADGF